MSDDQLQPMNENDGGAEKGNEDSALNWEEKFTTTKRKRPPPGSFAVDLDSDDDDEEEESKNDKAGDEEFDGDGDDAGDDVGDVEEMKDNEKLPAIDQAEVEDLIDVSAKTEGPKKKKKRAKAANNPPPRRSKILDDMDDDDYEDRVENWIKDGVKNMKKMKEQDENEAPPGEEDLGDECVVPAWINDRLFGYQRSALKWMWELHCQEAGGILGDEMGLGKTVQICSYLGTLVSNCKVQNILIISPATMLAHWLAEMAKWAPGVRRFLIHQSGETDGRSRTITRQFLKNNDKWLKKARHDRLYLPVDKKDIEENDPASFCGTALAYITTYENIRRFPDIWTSHNWSYCVMDEAHKIRNPDADVTLACKRLRTTHRLALTGTPIQNDLKEVWSLFDWVFPGRLGTLPAFEQEFSDPIRRGGYSNATPMQVQLGVRCALVLRDLIDPYLLRRLKKDVKEVNRMPGKMEQVLFCRLNDRQRTMYEEFLRSPLVTRIIRGSPQLLAAVTTLRKICNHPDLVCPPDDKSMTDLIVSGFKKQSENPTADEDEEYNGNEDETLVERSGKLEVLAKILPLWKSQGHRVLIFCQWRKMLDIIQRFTALQGWKFGRLDGNTNVASRQKLVDTFNSDTSYFGILCTTRTGGVGLNLTGADRIILYDPDWNPQTDAQARERAWRFGQEREVTIYRLICAGTVEEKIYQRQIFKMSLSNQVLQDAKQKRMFSQKDLRDLFTLKVDSGSIVSGSIGITETAQLTRGAGYVDTDEAAANPVSKDDGETLKTVLKSKGLAGVFDHEIVESNDATKSLSAREMEEQAERIAREAINVLKESVRNQEAFTPTWTGRFGNSSRAAAPVNRQKIRAGKAGIGRPRGQAAASSSSLLASFRQRNDDIKTGGASSAATATAGSAKTKHFADLLVRIRTFVRKNRPTTDALLDEFSSVSDADAAVFRRLLKSVAVTRGGRWVLKPE